MIFNLINTVKELSSLKKVVRHINISLDQNSQDPIILIEKEYIDKTSKEFFSKLISAINKQYPRSQIVEYTVSQNLKKISYFSKKKPLSGGQLDQLFNSHPSFIDLVHTGRAFYKNHPLKSGIMLVRLSSKNIKLFSHNKFMTTILNKKSSITSKYLEQVGGLNISGLNIKIPLTSYFYSGFGSFYINNPGPNFRILPINTMTGFLKNPGNISLKKSKIIIDGVIKKHGYVEDINKKLNLKGNVHLSIKKNKISHLEVNSKIVKLDTNHKIVHLTFGINPFISNNSLQITDYERSHNYICIGIEDASNSHIDICLNAQPISIFSLIFFWIKQKVGRLVI